MSSPLRRSPRLAGKAPQLFEHPWARNRRVHFNSEEHDVYVENADARDRAQRVAAVFCPLVSLLMVAVIMVAGPRLSGDDILRR